MRKSSSKHFFNIGLFVALCAVAAMMIGAGVGSAGRGPGKNKLIKESPQLFAVGLGGRTFNIQPGRDTASHYLGAPQALNALQEGKAQARTMVSDDFNGDSMGDLVTGYANNGAGIVSVRAGNPQATAPTDPEILAGLSQGKYPAPFSSEATLYSLPEAADFLQVGDFNSDGNSDVVAAARNSQALYLLAGDGRGSLGEAQRVELPGSLTALQVNESKQPGVFASLALGVRTNEGVRVLVYSQAGGGLEGKPDVYSMPADVTGFAFGKLDDDVTADVAVATANQLVVIHRPDGDVEGSTASIETENVPFVIRGIAVGEFVWDRGHQREIALLSDDGTVHLYVHGNPDTRSYTPAEMKQIVALKKSYTFGQTSLETLTAENNKLIRANRARGWKEAQTISTGASPAQSASGQILFQRANSTDLPTDDLLIGNGANNRVQLARNQSDAAKLGIKPSKTRSFPDYSALSIASAPIAAVSMRLNVNALPGTVVLQEGQTEGQAVILGPNSSYTVNSTSDLADFTSTAANAACSANSATGGPCTLRAAIMQSNHDGGSNTITVPNGTYTLSLGPPDDEANTGGATEQSGDLDIFSWEPFNGLTGDTSPKLTGVTINGGGQGTTIIQMGTLSPTLSTNNPTNKERVLEVNDIAVDGFADRVNVTINNLTIQNGVEPIGSTNTPPGVFLDGGGIWFDGTDDVTNVGLLTLHAVTLSGNTCAGGGGGVNAQFGSLRIESSSIVRANTSQHKVAGGVRYTGGNTVETQYLSIDSSTIGGVNASDGNQAIDTTFGGGAGVDSAGGGTGGTFNGIVITNTTFQNNVSFTQTGTNGGGAYESQNGPVFTFTAVTATSNTSRNNGGAFLINGEKLSPANTNATVTMNGVTITGNTADSDNSGAGNGGGIYNLAGALTIQNNGGTPSHIDSNNAINGGGIFSTWKGTATPAASLTMTNGTIGQAGAANNAKNNGGGLAVDPAGGTAGTINLTSVTITANVANSDSSGSAGSGGDGGGIYVGSGSINSLSGCTIDSNVVNVPGTDQGDGIRLAGGAITGAGTININSGDSLRITGGTFTSTSGTLNLTGDFINSGGTFAHGSGTFVFNGTGAQRLTGTTSSTFNNLQVNKTVGTTLTSGVNTSIAGNLTLTQGNLDLSTFTMNRTAAGGTLTLSSGTLLKIGGTNTLPSNFATHVIGTTNTVEYAGTGQSITVPNSAQKYGNLTTSGSGTKTLLGSIGIASNLTIGTGTAINAAANNVNIAGNWINNVGAAGFTSSGLVTFDGTTGTQSLTGNTTFFNLTLNNSGATTDFGTTTTTIASNLVTSAGTMSGNLSTIIFTGGAGTISGANAKNFNNLTINAGASISNTTGGNTTILNDFSNAGTYTQAAGLTTTFNTGADGSHSFLGSGATTFGNFTISSGNTVAAGSLNFNVVGATFTATGDFTGNTSTVTFNGAVPQTITGNGNKNFSGLTTNNAGGVTLNDGTGAVDASVSGLLTLTTNLTVASGAILQQSGTSAPLALGDVIGTVRRTDLGVTERSFGNVNNSITVNSGTPPTQMDFNLVKSAPGTFPGTVKVVPRDITLTPTGGSGISATVKLRYLDSELTGPPAITEANLVEWKNVGGTTWTPQGGTVDTTNNFVSLAGVSSFSEWAIAEGSDLTLTKANNVSNAAVTGQAWNWTLTATNGGAPATFTAGQTIFSDNLPNANVNYGTPTVQNVSNITGSGNISCSINVSSDLTCTANGGSVTFDSNIGVSKFDVVFSATPQTVGSFVNPRAGGNATIDPNNNVVESNEGNNTAANNTVTVSKANTTASITNAPALTATSVVGQPVTVTWGVAVNSPGSLGAPLTGNVTISDGTNSCTAAVSAGQCDVTFTSPGAKNLTATYGGDTNYNASPASSPATPHTVNKADTTTTIYEDNPDPSSVGQSVTVKWTFGVNNPGAGTPTGNVTVTVSGGAETCNAAASAGQCSLTLNASGTRTITANYPGDSNFNGSSDTESHDVTSSTASVNDAQLAEPTSGTRDMVFTIALSAPATAAVSVNFATADQPVAAGHAVAGTCGAGGDYSATNGTASFAIGDQVKTVNVPICADADNAEPDETFLVNLSSPVGLSIADGTATGTITVANPAGTLIISEFRHRGPSSTTDEFVELYNNTNSAIVVPAGGYGLFKMGASCVATPVLVGTVGSTTIPARGHYLLTGSTYSLANYGGTNAALGNATLTSDIEDDRNIALFSTADITAISSTNLLDAVGFGLNTGGACDLLREGTTLAPVAGAPATVDYSYFRTMFKASAGYPQDTNNNAADFKFADTAGTTIAGIPTALGAPGPENLTSPIRRDTSGIGVLLLDTSVSSAAAPNRFRDFSVVPNGASGSMTVRRRVLNSTGADVTRLRFRIVEMTTYPSPGGGAADLRALTSVNEVTVGPINDPATCLAANGVATTPCSVSTMGVTLETPPTQNSGGGYNATLSVPLGSPLQNTKSLQVNFKLGVQTPGNFKFLIIVEALP